VIPASVLLCLAGLGVSGYLTAAHYLSSDILVCSESGAVDCAKVTSSAASRLAGVPVADLGLVFFAAMLLLCLPWAWRSGRAEVHRLRILGAAGGVAFCLYLVYSELFRVRAICIYCTVVHVVSFALFLVVLAGGSDRAGGEADGGQEATAPASK
jgi:uncharacterized membrane protein